MINAPVAAADRIESLDVLRGFAILGILVLNIQSFAMPGAAYTNPLAYGDLQGANFVVWYLSQLLFDMKFNTIFATLYGAGIALLTLRSADLQASRNRFLQRSFWLFIIGMAHAYLLWYGDILVNYAITGVLVLGARNWRVKTLLYCGIALLFVSLMVTTAAGLSLPYWSEADRLDVANYWSPSAVEIQAEIDGYLGSIGAQFETRLPATIMMQTQGYLMLFLWRTTGLMLIGMALVKSGFLSARLSNRTYLLCMLPGLLIALPLIAWGISQNLAAEFSYEYSMFHGMLPNHAGSFMLSLCYISGLILLCKAGLASGLLNSFAAIGRTALSCYLLQTIICTSLFYGFGLGWFGSVERTGQAGIVLAVWISLVVFARLWLRRFRVGPFEWLWRSLTYRSRQPLLR